MPASNGKPFAGIAAALALAEQAEAEAEITSADVELALPLAADTPALTVLPEESASTPVTPAAAVEAPAVPLYQRVLALAESDEERAVIHQMFDERLTEPIGPELSMMAILLTLRPFGIARFEAMAADIAELKKSATAQPKVLEDFVVAGPPTVIVSDARAIAAPAPVEAPARKPKTRYGVPAPFDWRPIALASAVGAVSAIIALGFTQIRNVMIGGGLGALAVAVMLCILFYRRNGYVGFANGNTRGWR